MDKTRYEKIKSQLPSSLRMKLDHIKRYLDEGKAAAMVGAGFSKNARMPETAEMKDWNALGRDFYERLYGEATAEKLMFQNPVNLATQVEASFGRHELDDLIQQSLPDDVIVPSRLHVDLLNLGWHDIFTTNYDMLLERACLDADHPYTIVYNKDTLLYSLSPRIIKLHGSFPNIRPYIITEEDYRTYPQRYPEFVNTVRQSLIENLFCLIGFSGDDPNFKSWLGWLRDVMGKKISPVYFVTYDANLHDARRKLLAAQNIEVLNLHDLPGVGLQEGFDFLFHYLKHESNTQWRGSVGTRNHKMETAAQIKELTKDDEGFMGGFRNNMANVVEGFREFLSHVDLSAVAEDVIRQMADTAEILCRLDYPYIALLMRLEKYDRRLKESALKQRLQGLITTSAGHRQAMDVAYAIEVLHQRGRSYQTQVHNIISLCQYSNGGSVRHWLYALYFLGIRKAFLPTSKGRLYQLLDTVYANNNYTEGDADLLSDVRHGASQLAGVLAKTWGDVEATDRWKSLEASDEFNEVSSAFEKGARLV